MSFGKSNAGRGHLSRGVTATSHLSMLSTPGPKELLFVEATSPLLHSRYTSGAEGSKNLQSSAKNVLAEGRKFQRQELQLSASHMKLAPLKQDMVSTTTNFAHSQSQQRIHTTEDLHQSSQKSMKNMPKWGIQNENLSAQSPFLSANNIGGNNSNNSYISPSFKNSSIYHNEGGNGSNAYQHKVVDIVQDAFQRFVAKAQKSRMRRDLLNHQLVFGTEIQQKIEHMFGMTNRIEQEMIERVENMPQVFILFERILGNQSQMQYVLHLVNEKHEELIGKKEDLEQQLQELKEREKLLSDQNTLVKEMLNEKNKLLRSLVEEESEIGAAKVQEKKSNLFNLENARLNQVVQQLSNKINLLETGSELAEAREKLAQLTLEHEEATLFFKDTLSQKSKDNQRQKLIITNLNGHINKLDFENKVYAERLEKLQITCEKSELQLKKCSEERNEWRERAQMSVNDFQAYLARVALDKQLIASLQEQNKALKGKVDKYLLNRSKEVYVEADEEQQSHDHEIFQCANDDFYKDRTRFRKMVADLSQAEQERQFPDHLKLKVLDAQRGQLAKTEHESKQQLLPDLAYQLSYARPNFYALVQHEMKNFELDLQNIATRQISLNFIGTMRAIFDAKYNEFIMDQSGYRAISTFPDFTFSFLGHYTLDDSKVRIRLREGSEILASDESRVTFLLDLLNPKLQTLWEAYTFREFLSEKSSLDELFFYLHCRNLLFEGPVLLHPNASFDVFFYVRIERAEKVMEIMFRTLEANTLQQLKRQINERIKVKTSNKIRLIDSGFLLRIFLQFYRIERATRFKMLKEGFYASQTILQNGQFGVTFQNFKKLLELSYPRCTDLELAQLYRDAYSLGQGSVTAESFFTVASESGFLLRNLRLASHLTQQAPLRTKNTAPKKIIDGQKDQMYNYFFAIYEHNKTSIEAVLREACLLGSESLLSEIEDYQLLIKKNFQFDQSEIFKGKPFYFFLQRLTWIIGVTKNVRLFQLHSHYGDTEFEKIADSQEIVLRELNTIEHLSRQYGEFIALADRDQKLKDKNARRLQKAFMQKLTKFYAFISSLLSAKLKSSVKNKQ